jgi:hypothetical protein
VSPDDDHAADWRDAAAYAPLLKADRSIFAWEWLRRNPSYRAAAEQALGRASHPPRELNPLKPEQWGLHAFEPPHLSAPDVRPVWRTDVHPYVLPVHAERSFEQPDSFELARLGVTWTIVTGGGGHEHLLISDGLRAIRLDVLSGTLRQGPTRLHYLLAGFATAEKPLLTLRRLLPLWRSGRFLPGLQPAEARAKRFVLMLRGHDAVAAGADQREIAAVLLSRSAHEPRWRTTVPSVRSQAQRLVRGARYLVAGGYLELLQ